MSGPPPKPADRRQNRVTKSHGAVSAPGVAPPMPRGLHEAARTAWRSYWGDTVSGVMRGCDHVIAYRWVRNLDRYHRLTELADAEPIIVTGNGSRANPALDAALKLESSIRDDEKQLMVGALNRLRGGVRLATDVKSLAEMSAEVDDEPEGDPRTNLVVLGSRRRSRAAKRTSTEPKPL